MELPFDTPEFEARYHCDLPLGCLCSADAAQFRLWAPTAQRVTLRLYTAGTGDCQVRTCELSPGAQGAWTLTLPGDLHGLYYDYEVTVDGVSRRTADPYARSCGLNGSRSMVIDLTRTDPPGWREDRPPALPSESIIYELNVKEFSWDPASGVPEEERGRFLAFCREDTTLNNDGQHPTCLAYLKRLGVTYVQLMPIFDYGSVDEAGSADQFNWGYDPVNYNVPEGYYSTEASQGQVRVTQLKQAIQALHRSGLRVIMDVVYNHTYRTDSWLERTVPGYYYRRRANGTLSDGSGCGNEIASERSMCGKYILDSVLYWAEEYHIDGFRFDLMGLMDVALMQRIQSALDARYGVGEKLLFGEPWAAAASAVRPGTPLADKGNLPLLAPSIGAFCDEVRDAIKGGLQSPEAVGFVNGGRLDAALLERCVTGFVRSDSGFSAASPAQTIVYFSAHDDWTLWDRLVLSMTEGEHYEEKNPILLRANRLAAAIGFGCQGRPFFLSGEEFGRTKHGVRNSYCSSLEINRLDWTLAWENRALVDYYRGLIALRKRLSALTDKTPDAPARLLSCKMRGSLCAVVEWDNSGGDSPWPHLLIAYHTGWQTFHLDLPEGEWDVLVDDSSSFCWQQPKTVSGWVEMQPVSALVLGQRHTTKEE
jgi:pullulanase